MDSNKDRKRSHAEAEENTSNAPQDEVAKSSKRVRVSGRSLFVRSLPPNATSEDLLDWFSQSFPVKHATVIVDPKTKESRGYGFVSLADEQDAAEAKRNLDKQEWDGRRIRIDIAEPRHRNAASGPAEPIPGKPSKDEFQKPPKLIVRNLPWSIKKSEQLSNLFRSYGKVKFADLPQSKGILKGFGFVTIRGKKNAERALEALNGKEIDGRTLAVDWAVDKETWEQQQPAEQASADADNEVEDEDEEAPKNKSEESGASKKQDKGLDADLENFLKNHMQNLEDEDSDKEDDDAMEDDNMADEAKQPPKRTTDNSSTVFVRNLPFTSTDEQLKEFFGHFGKVRYARVVMDKVTDKPAGTGFVCFFDIEDAKKCIKGAPRPQQHVTAAKNSILQDESADPEGKYTLDGRLLQVAQAVNKQEASNLAESSLAKRNQKDKRRLYLLNEGSIPSNSPLYNLLTPADIQMRQASAVQRKKQVQGNPSLHISLTRLALRNIPRNMDSKALKELARKAVVGFAQEVREGLRQPLSKEENARDGKDAKEKERERKLKGKGIIRQAKVVFESAQGTKIDEKSGGGRSRGYGFVEYASHHWALMGLRYLNGQQLENENGKKQRLLVEFAIENAQVVHRRQQNEEKSRQQREEQAKTKAAAADDSTKRTGRRQGSKSDEGDPSEDSNAPKGRKEDMKQKLIARKRLMRKKKAQARS